LHAEFAITRPQVVPLFRLLPEELLYMDLSRHRPLCNFEIQLMNGVGSRHVFHISGLRLHDAHRATVKLVGAYDSVVKNKYVVGQEDDIVVRYENTRPVTAQLRCHEVKFKPLVFDKVLSLFHFEFQRPESPTQADYSGVHACRLHIQGNEEIVAISEIFTVVVPRVPFWIQTREPYGADYTGSLKTRAEEHLRAPLVLAEYRVTNPSPFSRRLRIGKNPRYVLVESFGNYKSIQLISKTRTRTGDVRVAGGVVERDEATYRQYRLEPGEGLTAQMTISIRLPGCAPEYRGGRERQVGRFDSLRFAVDPLQLEEVLENGESMGAVSLPELARVFIPPRLNLSHEKLDNLVQTGPAPCGWSFR